MFHSLFCSNGLYNMLFRTNEILLSRKKYKNAHLESQHWILDVQMNEDHSTVRRGFSVENALALKKFCLRIKNYDEKYKDRSMKMFQYRNSLKIEELTKILFRKITNE